MNISMLLVFFIKVFFSFYIFIDAMNSSSLQKRSNSCVDFALIFLQNEFTILMQIK